MIRVLIFLAALALIAVGLIQLVNQPGMVTVTWHGITYGRPLWQAVLVLLAVIVLLMIVIGAIRALLRAPGNASLFLRTRRRSKGFNAVTQGMIAVGSGDVRRAQKQAVEAQKILGSEPLALLLRAQAAQLSGDRSAAETAFSAMLDDPETKPLGLRGLFVEARRRGDAHKARSIAAEAVKTSPGLPWAGTALLEFQSVEKDWAGALATLARNADNRLIDKETAKRHRAVLLTARALEQAERDRAAAKTSALDALKLAPGLVPAAVLAARLLSDGNDIRKAAKVLETAWRITPHPDLAQAYMGVRLGDSARDRLARIRQAIGPGQRAREGARVRSWHAGRGAADLDVAHVEHLQGCDVQVDRANAGLAGIHSSLRCNQVYLPCGDVSARQKLADTTAGDRADGIDKDVTVLIRLDHRRGCTLGSLGALAGIDVSVGRPQDDVAALQCQDA